MIFKSNTGQPSKVAEDTPQPFEEASALCSLPFKQACTAWLESRRDQLSPRTYLDYSHYIKTLSAHFHELTLLEIDGNMLRSYQDLRCQTVGPGAINKELGLVIQIRKHINQPISDYQPLPPPESTGRALSPSEETVWERVCKSAADHPTWDVAALCSLLGMKTGLWPGEILSLKLKDIIFGNPSYCVVQRRGHKRVRQERIVVLIEGAEWAAKKLLKRAKEKCGCADPEHFLIPYTNKDHTFDPEKPARDYRNGMEHLLALCDTKFRRYDLRHHAISKALSNPKVSLAAASLHFGQISSHMKKRYYHGDWETLKVVAAAIGKAPTSAEVKEKARQLRLARGRTE